MNGGGGGGGETDESADFRRKESFSGGSESLTWQQHTALTVLSLSPLSPLSSPLSALLTPLSPSLSPFSLLSLPIPDLWLHGVYGCDPGCGERCVGERGGFSVPELPGLGPACRQLPVLCFPLLLVLRHHSQHRGAHLTLRQVRNTLCQVISPLCQVITSLCQVIKPL